MIKTIHLFWLRLRSVMCYRDAVDVLERIKLLEGFYNEKIDKAVRLHNKAEEIEAGMPKTWTVDVSHSDDPEEDEDPHFSDD